MWTRQERGQGFKKILESLEKKTRAGRNETKIRSEPWPVGPAKLSEMEKKEIPKFASRLQAI